MANVTAVRALNDYFNKDTDGKTIKSVSEFNQEIKALSPDEKNELGSLAAAAMGNTIGAKAQRVLSERIIDGVVHVWSIMDNAWVPLPYWNWVNGNTSTK